MTEGRGGGTQSPRHRSQGTQTTDLAHVLRRPTPNGRRSVLFLSNKCGAALPSAMLQGEYVALRGFPFIRADGLVLFRLRRWVLDESTNRVGSPMQRIPVGREPVPYLCCSPLPPWDIPTFSVLGSIDLKLANFRWTPLGLISAADYGPIVLPPLSSNVPELAKPLGSSVTSLPARRMLSCIDR